MISAKFEELRKKNEKALVLFITAGDPEIAQLSAIIDALVDGGADIIEIGLPFSDPIADGPTIQASTQRALDRGITPPAMLKALHNAEKKVPVLVMGYLNPLLRMGYDQAAAQFKDAGVSGTIISDLTPEESDSWVAASKAQGLNNIFLAAPTSTDVRLQEVAKRSSGFIYAVSRTGVTGAGSEAPPEVQGLVSRLKSISDTPVCVGFGISKPEHVRMVCQVADGAVIGSWLVEWLHNHWNDGQGRSELISLVRDLKLATHQQ